MTPKNIRKRLIDMDLTGAALARSLEISKEMVSAVISGQLKTPWVRRAIAERLGMTYRGMWEEEDPGTERGRHRPRRLSASLHTSSVAPNGDEDAS